MADITKIKKALNWKPTVSLSTGINELLNNINNWNDAPVWTPNLIKKQPKLGLNYSNNNYESC